VTGELRLTSEFADVEVSLDTEGNGPRLRIRDVRTDVSVLLDPLELESLVYVRHDELAGFLDPGSTRWSGPIDD
jgi:hypothetical protein